MRSAKLANSGFLKQRIDGIIATLPQAPKRYNPVRGNPEYDATAGEWLKNVAAVAANLIDSDRAIWEQQVSRPLDIFFSDKASSEQRTLRSHITSAYDILRQDYGNLAKSVLRLAKNTPQIMQQYRYKIEPLLVGSRDTRKLDFDKELRESVAYLHETPLVEPKDFFVPPTNTPLARLARVYELKSPPPLGDTVSHAAVGRLWGLVGLLEDLASGFAPDQVKLLHGFDWSSIRSQITGIEEKLLRSQEAIQAEPYILLAKVYFRYRNKPCQSLLHAIDPPALESWRRAPFFPFPNRLSQIRGALKQFAGERIEGGGKTGEQTPKLVPPEGECSDPMSLTEMANRLGNMDPRKFKALAEKEWGLKRLSRQKWQVRLDKMDKRTRHKIEHGRPRK